MFASKATRSFYNPALYDSMPDDVVEISTKRHAELLEGQSKGKVIAWGDDGYPFLADPPPLSNEELSATERDWRDAQLTATDGVVSRHRDEQEAGEGTTLSAGKYAELQTYRRALRNWPEAGEFPLIDHRPTAPYWLAEQL